MSKQKAVDGLTEEILGLQEIRGRILELVPDNLPDSIDVWGTEDSIRFSMPYDLELLRQIRRSLRMDWQFSNGWVHSLDQGSRLIGYYHRRTNTRLVLHLDPKKKGSTCQLEQIGTKSIPVYKVICD